MSGGQSVFPVHGDHPILTAMLTPLATRNDWPNLDHGHGGNHRECSRRSYQPAHRVYERTHMRCPAVPSSRDPVDVPGEGVAMALRVVTPRPRWLDSFVTHPAPAGILSG